MKNKSYNSFLKCLRRVIPIASLWLPYGFPMVSLWFPYGYSMITYENGKLKKEFLTRIMIVNQQWLIEIR
ncbi:hypothetical protein GCM10010976_28850 [Bizionia arctica]|uniref:Uncharacterized protein n=1 Tax=Bizionia arctica TaxID=1495645 RepID=A0A917GTT1_9FLAO|nr:hypothetical protein GCM10010976_28850 [Bizionia arctica]